MTATSDLLAALHGHFAPPAYATFEEVGNATGFGAMRHVDALSMSIWPSRGLLLHGFELKVSRGDWLREMKHPAKAEPIFKYCDHWWLVTGDKEVAKDDEVPPTWGHMTMRGARLVAVKPAPVLVPAAMSRSFLAAILRRVHENSVPKRVVDEERKKMRESVTKDVAESEKLNAGYYKDSLEALKKKLVDFETASGVTVDGYYPFNDPAKTGKVLKQVIEGGIDKVEELYKGHTTRLLQQAEWIVKMLKERLDPDVHAD